MFDMQRVGIKIADLRRSHNMTQTELADKMSVSYQAVSNWERGNSMPDISKLPLLAQVFEISIDEILEERSDLVEAAINNDMEGYLEKNEDIGTEIKNAVPILKPEQLETIVEKTEKKELLNIPELLSYMSASDVYELAAEKISKGEAVGIEYLARMSAEDVNRLAIQENKNGKAVDIYLEHMTSEGIKEVACNELRKGRNIEKYLGRMTSADVYETAVLAIDEYGLEAEIFARHMCQEDAGKLAVMLYMKGKQVKGLLEYIDGDSLKEIMRDMISE